MTSSKLVERVTFAEWAKDVLEVEEGQRKEFICRSLRSKRMLHVFGRYFFPNIIAGDYETPEAHIDLLREMSSPESSGLVYPRGFAKTTWEKVDTLHDIAYASEPVIVFYGATATDVELHFDAIKAELEDNVLLREVYGNLAPEFGQQGTKWNSRWIRTINGVNVIGRGAGKGRGVNIRHKRPTKVVIDDGETDEMVRSTTRREKYWRWITEVIEPSLDKARGKLKIIGTVIHPKCAVKRFHDERGGIFRKAIENGKSIWPEYWKMEDLLKKRDGYVREDGKKVKGIGTRAFSQEYMNTPFGEGLTMFRQQWLDDNAYDRMPDLNRMTIVMAVDPAAGEKSQADDYGLCVIGLSREDGKRYVLESSKYQGPIGRFERKDDGTVITSGARKWFHEAYVKWNPQIAGIEANQTVQAFWQLVRDEGIYRVMKLRPSKGIGKTNASKEERAKLVEPLVEQGMVKFNPRHTDLYEQLLAFPTEGEKDDVCDAFFHANSLLDAGGATIDEVKPTVTGTSGIRKREF